MKEGHFCEKSKENKHLTKKSSHVIQSTLLQKEKKSIILCKGEKQTKMDFVYIIQLL